jgi:hypothetical protein
VRVSDSGLLGLYGASSADRGVCCIGAPEIHASYKLQLIQSVAMDFAAVLNKNQTRTFVSKDWNDATITCTLQHCHLQSPKFITSV